MVTKYYLIPSRIDTQVLLDIVNAICRVVNTELSMLFGYYSFEDHGHVRYYLWVEYLNNLGTIRLVEDDEIPAQYIEVTSDSSELHRLVYDELINIIPIPSIKDLQEKARSTEICDPTTIIHLGLASQEQFDPETGRIIRKALQSPMVEVRRGATLAILLLKWREFAPAVNTALLKETDISLRKQLEYTKDLLNSG